MSNLQRHKDCPMRSEIGNCLAIGGFCTSVSKEICEALQNAYTNGKHSVEVNEDCISREYMLRALNGYGKDWQEDCEIAEIIRNAPSVIPRLDKEDLPRVVPKDHSGESTDMMLTTEQSSMGGKWKWVSQDTCDSCGYEIPHLERIVGETVLMDSKDWKYCPNCGCKRRKDRQ